MIAATSAAQAGYMWSGVIVVVVGWIFVGVGCHAMSKVEEFSYKLDYLIMAYLVCPIHTICPVCPVCPVCPDIIRIYWISMFCGHCPHFVDISVFSGYYLYIVDIVDISVFCGYYSYWPHYNLLSL